MSVSADEILAAAVRREIDVILKLIEADPHQWSTRPCPTCQRVSELAGRSFGCVARRERGR